MAYMMLYCKPFSWNNIEILWWEENLNKYRAKYGRNYGKKTMEINWIPNTNGDKIQWVAILC